MNTKAPNFTVIRGGLSGDRGSAPGRYVRSEVTMTRLLGVIGLHITRTTGRYDLHQAFYIDYEMNGFDDYEIFRLDRSHGAQPDVIREMKQIRFGALGGKWRPITKSDAERLIADAAEFNKKHGIELPPGIDEYGCYIDDAPEYTPEQRLTLLSKICIQPRCDYEAINYYLMRCCGMDREAAAMVWGGGDFIDVVQAEVPSSFIKNSISPVCGGKYRCESLIQYGEDYSSLITEIRCENTKVVSAKRISCMPISPWEASLKLNRDEYVVLAWSDCDPDDMYDELHTYYHGVTDYEHEAGTLYILFNDNNDNVMSPEYRIDDDSFCHIAVIDSGEIVISSPDPEETTVVANEMNDLITFELDGSYSELNCYRFSGPALGKFLDSGFQSFSEFLNAMQDDPENKK